MSIILDEREWAENAIAYKQLGAKPSATLSRVARYFRQVDGYSKSEVRKKIDDFLLQCDPKASIAKWDNLLDSIVSDSDKRPLVDIEGISITEGELCVIDTLLSRQPKRLAFALMCSAKYYNLVNAMNNNWVNTPDREIMKMANISTSVRRQSQMLREMRDAGLLEFSKKIDNLNVQVLFINQDSPTIIHITDYRNLGNQYLLYCGEPYFKCAQCGLTIKRNKNVQKYCSDCAAEMYIKKSVESVMRRRGGTVYT